jgi:RNA recognition motif-containing protein
LQFEKKLKDYGVDHYKELTLVEDRRNEGLNRGFAFLEFFSRLDAKLACRRLKNHEAAFGLDRKANVTFAVSYLEPDGKTMSEVGFFLYQVSSSSLLLSSNRWLVGHAYI